MKGLNDVAITQKNIYYRYKPKVVQAQGNTSYLMCLTMLNGLISELRDNLKPVHANSNSQIAAANDL